MKAKGLTAVVLVMIVAAFMASPATAYSPNQPGLQQVQVLGGFRDVGPIGPNVSVVGALYIPLRNLPLLFYYAEQASLPGSPVYHRFLTARQAAELFWPKGGFSQAMSYLEQKGLRVVMTAADSMIVFEGQAWQVERAFGVRIDAFTNGTLTFYSDVGPAKAGPWAYPYVSNLTLIEFARPRFLLTTKEVVGLSSRFSSFNVSFPTQAYPMTELAPVYNATALYDEGYMGHNVTVGVLDFFGDPTLAQDLAYFDSINGLPPANLTVVPIGPYNPNLGVVTGWNLEEDLDVEAVHSMAPLARVIVYVASGDLPLSAAIAFIDQQDQVSVLGQSFGVPESALSNLGWSFFYYNVYLSDVYYALGTAEGITFVAASGDGGGMGYSAGPIGAVPYPASSPWVLSVGGTAVYLSGGLAVQEAWSSMGFVPYLNNVGGSTGGYSAVEPMPWWQEAVAPSPPAGFPYGRAVPDVAAEASLSPGVIMVGEDNQTLIAGGTSEAAELTVGLLALLVQASGSRLGLVGQLLYQLYQLGADDAFEQAGFGYSIPWTAGPGYNLMTGLGALNVGQLAKYLEAYQEVNQRPSAEVYVNGNSTSFLLPGELANVSASVKGAGASLSSARFKVELVTLEGVALTAPMSYNSTLHLFTSRITVPANASGIAFVEVVGGSGGAVAVGASEVFLGYFANMPAPGFMYPYEPQLGLPVFVIPTSPTGNLSLTVTFNVTVLEYSPLNNS
ncbi:MAG: S53 family peptidase, partial [Acidilobus sp.]